jgi:cobalt-zinc-cadmium efflux system outer membrane protein
MIRVLRWSILFVATAAYAHGQDLVIPPRLTLDEAVRLATERNPNLAAARNAVEIAEAQRLDARLRPNPAVSFESEGYPLFESSRPAFVNNQELTFRVDQEIELAGRRRLRTQAAEASVSAVEATFRDARRQLEFDVRRAYFAVVLAKADLEVARGALSEIDQVIGLNRARYQQGEISGGELRRIQVERLKFVDDVFSGDLALRNARSALLAIFNAPDLGVEFDVVEQLALDTSAVPQALPPIGISLDPALLGRRRWRHGRTLPPHNVRCSVPTPKPDSSAPYVRPT